MFQENTPNPTTEHSIENVYEHNICAYLLFEDKDKGYIFGELQDSDYWYSGEPDGTFTDDSNINYRNLQEATNYYNRNYLRFWAFEDEDERDEFLKKYYDEV